MHTKLRFPRRNACLKTFFALLLGLAMCISNPAFAHPSVKSLELSGTPRIQWNANYGYCGETSLITAGLRFGQYTSQWTVRSLASPGIAQTSKDSQLLLGTNDLAAARRMRLDAQRGPRSGNFTTFMTWVRDSFIRGDVVMVGVQNNMRVLGETGPGDQSYDHIVPVYGYESAQPLAPGTPAQAADVLTISDNGLRTNGTHTPMLYSYTVGDLRRTRSAANATGGPVYSFSMRGPWYGLAVSGVADRDSEALPITVTVDHESESLQNQSVLTHAPVARRIQLTVSVTRPPNGKSAVLYQYNDFNKVPNRSFNEHAKFASQKWPIPPGEGSFIMRVSALSSDTRAFRAVIAP